MFYISFLEKLIPLKFREGTTILKMKTRPEEVFLILKGEVLNETTHRVFSMGSIVGETDIIYKRVST
jgi:hypothetical protein